MRNFVLACIASISRLAFADTIILTAPGTANFEQIAVVWIHGMQCAQEGYTSIARELQNQGAANHQAIWVGIPEFVFDAPEPIFIDHYVEKTIKQLKDAGFKGDNILLAAHSLGGLMSQLYAKKNADKIKGQILMGSVLLRSNHEINQDGSTHFNYPVPTLTLGGTKDGLLRVSRMAESFYHQVDNIESAQAGMFPVFTLEGGSHMSFMSGTPSSTVMKGDLRAEVNEDDAHKILSGEMVKFIQQVVAQDFSGNSDAATQIVLKPLLDAMTLEGSYKMKPPCYAKELVNPVDVPTCLHGSPWIEQFAQKIMGGDFVNKHIKVRNDDNFHRVQSIAPFHLPTVTTTCDKNCKSDCFLETITVSENHYEFLDKMDTGFYPLSASEIKTKFISRQAIQQAGGNIFTETDEVSNRCAEINDAAIKWAYDNLSTSARSRYQHYGEVLATGDDKGPYSHSQWIWTMMDYQENKDKTLETVRSAMMHTPTDKNLAGFHYCKVLSPFRAIEFMMIDSLYEADGIKNDYQSVDLFLQ